jgi:hypothetical protein
MKHCPVSHEDIDGSLISSRFVFGVRESPVSVPEWTQDGSVILFVGIRYR